MSLLSKNNKTQEKTQEIKEDSLSWEVFRNDLIEKSERKAWNIAKVACGACVVLCIAISLMMPLKTTEPYVIQVDKSTGLTEILHLSNTEDIPVSEMMDKYWVSQFIYAHESYDWNTLNDDIEKVRQLALPAVFDRFIEQYTNVKQESLDSKLKNKFRILVKLKSVVIKRGIENVATVRFSKTTINNESGNEVGTNHWTANISFDYYPDFDTKEKNRLVNPFGFKVLSFRVDPELS